MFYQEEALEKSLLRLENSFDMLLFVVFENGAAKTTPANLTSLGEFCQNF